MAAPTPFTVSPGQTFQVTGTNVQINGSTNCQPLAGGAGFFPPSKNQQTSFPVLLDTDDRIRFEPFVPFPEQKDAKDGVCYVYIFDDTLTTLKQTLMLGPGSGLGTNPKDGQRNITNQDGKLIPLPAWTIFGQQDL